MCYAITLRKRTLHPDHTQANLVCPVTTWVFSTVWLQGSRKGTESHLEMVFKCSPGEPTPQSHSRRGRKGCGV